MATMNPIEQEGTYPLPEAQTDRFMLKVVLDYPRKEEEKLIIRQNVRARRQSETQTVVRPDDILRPRKLVREVYMDEKIEQYIVDIVTPHASPTSTSSRPHLHDRVRWKPTRQHQHGPRRQGLRLHQTPRLCDPRGCACRMP
jgi:MoxR-like ATPase